MAAKPQQNALSWKTQGQNLKKWKIQKAIKKRPKMEILVIFLTSLVWGHVVLVITAQICTWKMKKVQNFVFSRGCIFGPNFAHFPLFPADMLNFWLKTVNTISFAPKKVVQTSALDIFKSKSIWGIGQYFYQ